MITTTGFTSVARLAAKAAGVEGLSIAEYPGVIGVHQAEIEEKVRSTLFDRIVDGLTRFSGKQDAAGPGRNPDAIVFAGTYDEVNAYFSEHEWTDGLPIVPPTQERVEAFLRFTDRTPDEGIAVLPQARLRATPRNIAANAVMAGCRPQHLPILIAAVEAVADERFNLNNIGTTWGLIPYLIVNGPIVTELGIECRGQPISKGPNPAIGRAFGLIIRNIAGYKPGRNQMGTFGYPLAFALAENEADTPWDPLHVERGYARSSSTVSTGTTLNWGFPPAAYARPDKSGGQAALELLCIDLVRKPSLARLAEQGPAALIHDITFLLSPSIAKSIAANGYSKNDIRKYVYENARVPLRELEWELKYALADVKTVPEKVSLGMYPKEFLVGSGEMVRVLPNPEIINIVVCGDPDRNRLKTLDTGYTRLTTKEITLPRNWSALLGAK